MIFCFLNVSCTINNRLYTLNFSYGSDLTVLRVKELLLFGIHSNLTIISVQISEFHVEFASLITD